MWGFDWVDGLILIFLVAAIYKGIRIGIIALLFGFGGFLAALFVAGWLMPYILPINNRTVLETVNANLVLLSGILVGIRSYEYGQKLHVKLKFHLNWHKAESLAGVTISLGLSLVIVWLTAAGIGALPFVGLSNSVNNSFIIKQLDWLLPAAPTVFEEFAHYVNPNYPLQIYDKMTAHSSIGVAPMPKKVPIAIKADGSRITRITNFDCNVIVDGSGFVVGKDLVATDAHVIAGVHHPVIKIGQLSYLGVPVLFDPNQDLALIRLSNLNVTPLLMANQSLSVNQIVYAAGFPNSIYTISIGSVINDYPTVGSNIYGLGNISRPSYTLAMSITRGSSGSPLFNASGQVVGIIFAQSKNQPNITYAMTTSALISDIAKVNNNSTAVGTGSCYRP